MTATYRVPQGFALDADSRDILDLVVAHRTTQHLWIRLDPAAMGELRADAAHYADPDNGFAPGLATSARAMLAALDAGPVTPPATTTTKRKPWVCPGCGTSQALRPAHRLCLDCR